MFVGAVSVDVVEAAAATIIGSKHIIESATIVLVYLTFILVPPIIDLLNIF
jgi:hypothetical protein